MSCCSGQKWGQRSLSALSMGLPIGHINSFWLGQIEGTYWPWFFNRSSRDNYSPCSKELVHLIPCVCLCVSACLSVCTLLAKRFDLWPWFLALRLTLTLASVTLKVKVVGQRSRSNTKIVFFQPSVRKVGQRSTACENLQNDVCYSAVKLYLQAGRHRHY